MNYEKKRYINGIKSFDYLVVPKSEYNYELICKVHNLPFLLSEWRSFYSDRFLMVNNIEDRDNNFINLPIITEQECWNLGL